MPWLVIGFFCCVLLYPSAEVWGKNVYSGQDNISGIEANQRKIPNTPHLYLNAGEQSGDMGSIFVDGRKKNVFGIGNVYLDNSRTGSIDNNTEIHSSTIIIDNR